MIEAIIFDMDGVIIDSEPIHLRQNQEIFTKWGLKLKPEVNYTLIGTNSVFKWQKLKELFNLPQSVTDLIKLDRETYFKHLQANKTTLKPIKGSYELIKELHNQGFKIALASSSPIEVIEIVIEAFDLKQFFDVIVSGDFVKHSKPSPDIFNYAAKKLNVANKNCVVIEDSANGILAATTAKMKTVGYQGAATYQQDLSLANLVIKEFSEFDLENLENKD